MRLFIDAKKVAHLEGYLKENRIEVYPYEDVQKHLVELAAEKKKIGFDENVCNQGLYECISGAEPKHFDALIEHIKAVKNPTEMKGMRTANIKNCASLI